ncbi:molybdopterin-dependent oxidoreductase [Halarchaeum sp. P4]|uniref:molybdopterin-dependent oxidoreductase n=1 Tax=Halarchaeum sp. P4 TaxID=3421639 RepID=UPI003EBC2CBA
MLDTDRVAVHTLAALAAVAGSFAVGGTTLAFVVTPAYDVVARYTPGLLVGVVVTQAPGLTDAVAYAVALVLTVAALTLLVALTVELAVRLVDSTVAVFGTAVAVTAVAAVATGYPFRALAAGLPAGAVVLYFLADPRPARVALSPARRRVLRAAGGVAAFGALAGYVGRDVAVREPVPADGRYRSERVAALEADAERNALDVEGLPGLLSANAEFYTVDINSADPYVESADWSLRFEGAVENTAPVDFDALVTHDARTDAVDTLRCVSDPVDGTLTDTAVWTGVPVAALLEGRTISSDCGCVMVHAADDYHVEFPLEALREGFLAIGMNGDPLPRSHGHPVRLLVPGHWGEVNVKWVTSFEFLEREAEGYWEQRGWHGTGPVNAVTKIWATRQDAERVTLAGVAYAGTRGVARVEVSVDGGDTWRDARLSEPLEGTLDGDVWRQWAYTWDSPPSGDHEIRARAVTEDGTVQPQTETGPFPSGSSGWAETTLTV